MMIKFIKMFLLLLFDYEINVSMANGKKDRYFIYITNLHQIIYFAQPSFQTSNSKIFLNFKIFFYCAFVLI